MTTSTIRQLPSASELQGTELFESVQLSGGFQTSVKTKARDIVQSPTRYVKFDQAGDHPPSFDEQPWSEGMVQWDRENHTLKIFNDESDMAIQVGQETVVRVRNESGATILNGSPCYFNGTSPAFGVPTIGLAKADFSITLASPSVATHDIPNNSNGYVTKRGIVRDIDTSSLIAGMPLWVSVVSAGVLTNTRPVSPDRSAIIGLTTISHETSGAIWVEPAQFADAMKTISYSMPLAGVTDNVVPLQGTFATLGTSATGDTATTIILNNHVFIKVNELTTGGDILITGDSVNETTAVVTLGDTETISVDPSASRPASIGSQIYQSNKKWHIVTSIDVSTGDIAGINYNYGAVGYPDAGNRSFRLLGYRWECYSSGTNADVRLRIFKVSDDGQKRMTLLPIEDIGIDSNAAGDQIVDHVRTGGDDRSYNSGVVSLWPDNRQLVFKQGDFYNYWSEIDNRQDISGRTSHEGIIIAIEGEPDGGITNVDFIILTITYELT